MIPGLGHSDSHSSDRERLQKELLAAVKQCQTRFGGRTELATELEPNVVVLCSVLELILSHGLKTKTPEKKSSAIRQVTDLVCGNGETFTLWDSIQKILTHHERERYELLHQVWTDRGRGRAWLRSALNERCLERYLIKLLSHETLSHHYEDWAFLRNQETSSILPDMAAGLGSILFAMSIDRPELNHVSNSIQQGVSKEINEYVIEETMPVSVKRKSDHKRHKKGTANIILFEDNEEDGNEGERAIKTSEISSASVQHNIKIQENIETLVGVECAEEATNALCDAELSNSDTEHNAESDFPNMPSSGLRPVNNYNVGELIPISSTEETHSSEDSVSVPSFSEENEAVVSNLSGERIISESACSETSQKEVEKLKKILEQVNELNGSLRMQIVQANLQHQRKQDECDAKILELNRENEVLKHQLRKYVNAVKMLKQESQDIQEENLYEQKLVQVAEMHGELMELNERLQRNLIGKEGIIRRLYLELEALRGPLGPTEVDIHTQIISLWVPSVFLTGTTKPYHVYQVHVRISDEEWNVYRRYAQFYGLHKETKKKYPVISAFQFPPKKTIGNKDAKFVEERRLKLQQYLRRLMNHIVANTPPLASAPSKSLLTSALPFFGEQNEPSSRRNANPRSSIPRNSAPSSPQYAGL